MPAIDESDVASHARRLGQALTPDETAAYVEELTGRLAAFDVVDGLVAGPDPVAETLVQSEQAPAAAQNSTGGWVSRFELRSSAVGPLSGLTVAVKESIEIAGTMTTPGNPAIKHRATRHAAVVQRVLDAGGTIIGKTAATDFELDGAGVTGSAVPTHPPGLIDRLPAGSSSGSAAVVAAGEVDLAIGGDGGGSIREPASWCGCVGMKPTHGLVPTVGGFPFAPTLGEFGPLAATVEQCALLLGVLADGRRDYRSGLDDGRRLRIGVLEEGFGIPGASDPAVDEVVRATADRLAASGLEVGTVRVPEHRQALSVWSVIAAAELARTLEDRLVDPVRGRSGPLAYVGAYTEMLDERPAELPPTALAMFMTGLHVAAHPRPHLAAGHEAAHLLRSAYDRALRHHDVLLMPTTPALPGARPSSPLPLRELWRVAEGSYLNAAPFNATGHPAISVPCGDVGGLPVGAQLIARHHEDHLALVAARQLERTR